MSGSLVNLMGNRLKYGCFRERDSIMQYRIRFGFRAELFIVVIWALFASVSIRRIVDIRRAGYINANPKSVGKNHQLSSKCL